MGISDNSLLQFLLFATALGNKIRALDSRISSDWNPRTSKWKGEESKTGRTTDTTGWREPSTSNDNLLLIRCRTTSQVSLAITERYHVSFVKSYRDIYILSGGMRCVSLDMKDGPAWLYGKDVLSWLAALQSWRSLICND